MYIAKTSRRKGFHKLTIPKATKIGKTIAVPKVPKPQKLPTTFKTKSRY